MPASDVGLSKLAPSNNEIREAAGSAIERLVQLRGTNILSWPDIEAGFQIRGQKIHFASKAVGIFKPKELSDGAALSLKQVLPSRAGRTAPYDDRVLDSGVLGYRLDRSGRDTSLVVEADKLKLPLIFFKGVADGRYEVIYPVLVGAVDLARGEAKVILGGDEPRDEPEEPWMLNDPIEKSYSTGMRKNRRHQAAFRQRVLYAYGLKCALTGLPLPELLEASHIIPDTRGGEASVRNGIALSNLHHTAYERNLLGIDPDGRVHLSDLVKNTKDGPMLEHGLLKLNGATIRMPTFEAHRPNRDFLALKFDEFKQRRN